MGFCLKIAIWRLKFKLRRHMPGPPFSKGAAALRQGDAILPDPPLDGRGDGFSLRCGAGGHDPTPLSGGYAISRGV